MSEFDRITLEYINSIDSIEIDYSQEITNIELSIGQNVQTVYSVNNLYGDILLSASTTLNSASVVLGEYNYIFTHNLSTSLPIISIYNSFGQNIITDIEIINQDSVKIKSLIDLNTYKVIVQK